MRPLVAHCHFGLGTLYLRTGDRLKAGEHLGRAGTMYREMGMTFWLEKAEAMLGSRGETSARSVDPAASAVPLRRKGDLPLRGV